MDFILSRPVVFFFFFFFFFFFAFAVEYFGMFGECHLSSILIHVCILCKHDWRLSFRIFQLRLTSVAQPFLLLIDTSCSTMTTAVMTPIMKCRMPIEHIGSQCKKEYERCIHPVLNVIHSLACLQSEACRTAMESVPRSSLSFRTKLHIDTSCSTMTTAVMTPIMKCRMPIEVMTRADDGTLRPMTMWVEMEIDVMKQGTNTTLPNPSPAQITQASMLAPSPAMQLPSLMQPNSFAYNLPSHPATVPILRRR
ncbi:Hypothetical predicted protein [Podarcis lilfordi]|uniref:Uncharacterized protein n=1 Tax=Podarcis lilfordi TaxID=74358 RepID=A0AA35LMT5_9SAUR|nr:Hypothetical predicted protein [Podarcis lilfordi]